MRLYGRWHKGHRRCGNAAYVSNVVRVAGLPVAFGRVVLPPRGAALRQARVGMRLSCTVLDYERYWRTPGQRVPRHKPPRYQWSDWRLSQGFKGGKWQPSQLRKPPKPSKRRLAAI